MEIYFKTSDHSSGHCHALYHLWIFQSKRNNFRRIEPKSKQADRHCLWYPLSSGLGGRDNLTVYRKNRISSAQSSPRHGIPDPDSAGCPAVLYLWSSWEKTAFGSIFILCHLRIRGRIPPVLYSRQVSPDYRCICRQHRNPDRMRHHIPCIT